MNAAATNEMVADQEVQESDGKSNADEWIVFLSVFGRPLGLEIVALPLARSTKRHELDRTPTLKQEFFLGCETPKRQAL